jgi:hypothetical protein
MNFLTICQNVADQLDGGTIATVEGTLTRKVRRLKENVNRAYNTVWLALAKSNESREYNTTFTTTANTEAYDIPASLLSVDQLKIGSDLPLRIVPWPEYERYKADTFAVTLTGDPIVASIYNRDIYLWPVPDASTTVNVRGQRGFTEMDEDADEPMLEDDFHRVIQELALYFEMDYEGNPRATSQYAIADNMLKLVRNNQRAHYEEAPRRIGPQELRRMNIERRMIRGV